MCVLKVTYLFIALHVSVVFCKTLLKGYDHHQDSPFSKTDYIQSILGEKIGLSHFSISQFHLHALFAMIICQTLTTVEDENYHSDPKM